MINFAQRGNCGSTWKTWNELKRLTLRECATETPMPGEVVCEALDYSAVATDLGAGMAYACSLRSPIKETPNEDSLAVFELAPQATVLASRTVWVGTPAANKRRGWRSRRWPSTWLRSPR